MSRLAPEDDLEQPDDRTLLPFRDPAGKKYLVRYLAYVGMGSYKLRGLGYGRHEECYLTLEEARERMRLLVNAGRIEDITIQKDGRGDPLYTWNEGEAPL